MRFRVGIRVGIGLVACLISSDGLRAQVQFPGVQQSENATGDSIFVPAPREYVRPLQKAEEAIGEGEFAEAVDLLGQILADETIEDYFLPAPGGKGSWMSLKSRALSILEQLPPRGRELFELKYGIEAQQILAQAVKNRNLDEIAKISNNYFHTRAGYEATILLGRLYLDQGRYFSAIRSFQRIVESPVAREQYSPQVQVLLATAWLATGDASRAEDVLRKLPEEQLALMFRGEEVDLSGTEDQAFEWLQAQLGQLPGLNLMAENNWMMFRGNAQRLAESTSGFPLLINAWQTPAVLDANDRSLIGRLQGGMAEEAKPAIPAISPLAVGDYVIMRTPEYLVGVELKTGLRKWFYPWDREADIATDSVGGQMASGNNPREAELRERMWLDNVYGQPSSDGKQVYFVDDLPYRLSGNRTTINFARNGVGSVQPNHLVALKLVDDKGNSVEGKMAWIVGGEDGYDQPWSKGVYFLGSPLPISGRLYALGEINGEIRLYAVDARDAALLWSRQIATVNHGSVQNVSYRRVAGASPSYADGLVICPTSTGAVIAVDLATQAPLWGFQYQPVETGRRGYSMPQPWQPGERWADGSVTIVNGHILLTPVDQEKLHCIDLLTGQPKWAIDRDGMSYLGAVDEETIALVGATHCRGVNLKDGKQAWETPMTFGGPSGRGYASEGKLFVPTADDKVVSLNIQTGELLETVDTAYSLGNLICHEGYVVSHNVDVVAAFYQDEINRPWVETRLQETPDDLQALLLKSQLCVRDKDWDAAVATAQEALAKHPDEIEVEEVLVSTLMLAARNNSAFDFEPLERYEAFLLESDYRSEYLMLKTKHSIAANNPTGVIKALLLMADAAAFDSTMDRQLIRVEDRDVDGIRWAYAALSKIADDAGADEEVQRQIDSARRGALEDPVFERTWTLHQLFGEFWRDPEFELQLVELCIETDHLLEAEQLLSGLLSQEDLRIRARALERQAHLLEIGGFVGQAQQALGRLATEYPDQVFPEGMTSRKLLEDFVARHADEKPTRTSWLEGGIDVASSNRSTKGRYSQMPLPAARVDGEWAPSQLKFSYYSTNLFIDDENGKRVATINVADGGAWQFRNTSRYSLLNHLMICEVTFSNLAIELIGIDLFKAMNGAADAIVWRQRLFGDVDTQSRFAFARNNKPQFRTTTTNTSLGLTITQNLYNNKLVGSHSGPHRTGLVLHRGSRLICIDPIQGTVLWRKDHSDVGSQVVSDGEAVHVLSSDQSSMVSCRLLDGAALSEQEVAKLGQIFAINGPTLVGWKPDDQKFLLKAWDAASAEIAWEADFPYSSRGYLLDHRRLAILDAGGDFRILDLKTGSTTFQSKVESEDKLQSIQVYEDDLGKILVVNRNALTTKQKSRQNPKIDYSAVPYTNPLIDGLVYAFDNDGKALWPNPAQIDQFSLLASEVGKAPVLIFSRYYSLREENGGNKSDLVMIDRRDGRLIADDRGIDTLTPFWMLNAHAKDQQAVIVGPREYTLTFTDLARPPSPAAQTGYPINGGNAGGASTLRVFRGIGKAFDLSR
ncbi:MAG: PQQ-binding-like beta-propeller repeat protein [Planctomycetota bacterium]|nr:PQQ-binding-like beta-propeller repeat protein [Planctomycetota bacterium]